MDIPAAISALGIGVDARQAGIAGAVIGRRQRPDLPLLPAHRPTGCRGEDAIGRPRRVHCAKGSGYELGSAAGGRPCRSPILPAPSGGAAW